MLADESVKQSVGAQTDHLINCCLKSIPKLSSKYQNTLKHVCSSLNFHEF